MARKEWWPVHAIVALDDDGPREGIQGSSRIKEVEREQTFAGFLDVIHIALTS